MISVIKFKKKDCQNKMVRRKNMLKHEIDK